MAISPKSQYGKIAEKILKRRNNAENNDKPATETTETTETVNYVYNAENVKGLKKKDLREIIDATEGYEYAKDDKLEDLVTIVCSITK